MRSNILNDHGKIIHITHTVEEKKIKILIIFKNCTQLFHFDMFTNTKNIKKW